MDKLTEHTYNGYYDYNNELTITGISNANATASDLNKLIDEVNALLKKLEDIQKWKIGNSDK